MRLIYAFSMASAALAAACTEPTPGYTAGPVKYVWTQSTRTDMAGNWMTDLGVAAIPGTACDAVVTVSSRTRLVFLSPPFTERPAVFEDLKVGDIVRVQPAFSMPPECPSLRVDATSLTIVR